jgi:hypothetical protein
MIAFLGQVAGPGPQRPGPNMCDTQGVDWGKEDSMKVVDAGERRPKRPLLKMVPVLILSAMTVLSVAIAAGFAIIPPQPSVMLTGIVSDSVCGGDHGIRARGDPECTRACVALGAHYALMVGKVRVGKKMYTLYGHEADLDRFAGKEVRVLGRALSRDTIIVDEVDHSYTEAAGEMN